ncbi:hypothetical protein [Mameliella sediminis]|uniref:hypothetical protein n=1 Tax=Mameliella sediminis TaxID=2836866 RepID=UPI001C494AF9|nr:hypothetical protein [Mameliella sediminis]MBV7394144.1 hypothetical protein [Mameliella sediminis]MBY6162444.1 hypothetical protein [Mameliella alba]MBY6170918.1 hypothetical protein [Mameliella alba]MBY6175931.1 hypothetical protein [Mameliella alba]
MITLDDIEDMTCLTRDEIEAVAEHDHLPEVNASCLAEYLMQQHHGAAKVQQMICEDIREALHRGDKEHAKDLYGVLHHFLKEHPEAARGAPA